MIRLWPTGLVVHYGLQLVPYVPGEVIFCYPDLGLRIVLLRIRWVLNVDTMIVWYIPLEEMIDMV
jgi:hypothetical protein